MKTLNQSHPNCSNMSLKQILIQTNIEKSKDIAIIKACLMER